MGVENGMSQERGNTTMGRPTKVTADEVLAAMLNDDTPPQVWTSQDVVDLVDVSRTTANARLSELVERGSVDEKPVSGSSVYYPADQRSVEEVHRASLQTEWEGEFVGDTTDPSVVTPVYDDELGAGDTVQLQVDGVPGSWGRMLTRSWENNRHSLDENETDKQRTQALISGELYAAPTVPIEHTDYPEDYDLELEIGGQYQEVEGRSRPVLVATGVKNHLIKPCNDALFIEDVAVDWISPQGEGQELEVGDLSDALEHESVEGDADE